MKLDKKFIFMVMIFVILIGCSANNSENSKEAADNVSVQVIADKLMGVAELDKDLFEKRDITLTDNLERYGINKDDIKEGVAYASKASEEADTIIVIEANSEDSVENIENALANEVIGLNETWGEDAVQGDKVKNHVFKTNGLFVTLIVAEKYDIAEKSFDAFF